MKTNAFSQKLCVWSGPAMAVTLLSAFIIMGFLPPPDPRLSGEEIVTLFQEEAGGPLLPGPRGPAARPYAGVLLVRV